MWYLKRIAPFLIFLLYQFCHRVEFFVKGTKIGHVIISEPRLFLMPGDAIPGMIAYSVLAVIGIGAVIHYGIRHNKPLIKEKMVIVRNGE